jgi:periplasmic divalent cation tolerance protein
MTSTGYAIVLVTVSDKDEAEKIAAVLLKERKAACVNIIPSVNSRYWWKGKIESSDEAFMVIKTRASVLTEVIESVKKHHSYTVPEIVALSIADGNQDYLEWIGKEVRD